jgi:hypothetical protein
MDAISLFEQLANMTLQHVEITQVVNLLPDELKDAFITNNSQQLRKQLSGQQNFPDSRTVAQG